MPSPSPAISLYSSRTITGLGPAAESGQPILIESIECTVRDEKEIIRGKCGSIVAVGEGNVSAEWRFTCLELARYGIQDSHPGRISPTALGNLAKPEFGCIPSNGLFLFSSGTRTRTRGRLPVVQFTVTCDGIERDAGSWEGVSTPGIQIGAGGSAGTRPTFSFTSPQAATLGSAFSYTLSASGSGTLTWSVAEGYSLPAGLSLNTANGALSGTPTGAARQEIVVFKVSSAYGFDTKALTFNISDPAAAAAFVAQVYVRFQVEAATPGDPDEFWVIAYNGMSPAPTSKATFYSATPAANYLATGGLDIENPNADTGTTSSRDWTVHEVVGLNADDEWEVWYRLDATEDNHISVLLASGQDPVLYGNGYAPDPVDEPIDYPPPDGDPEVPATPAAWPGYRLPSPRFTHYYLYQRASTGSMHIAAVGGSYAYADLTDFESQHPTISTSYEDGAEFWLVELFEVGFGYLYQREAGDTAIEDTITANRSPLYHLNAIAAFIARKASDAARRTTTYSAGSLPADPGGLSGPAIPTDAKVYARTRNPYTSEDKTYGFSSAKSATYDTLNEWTNARGTWNVGSSSGEVYYFDYGWFDDSGAGGFGLDQNGYEIIMELWVKNGGGTWQSLFIYSGEDELVGECIAAGVSPVNNAHTAPGRYYA